VPRPPGRGGGEHPGGAEGIEERVQQHGPGVAAGALPLGDGDLASLGRCQRLGGRRRWRIAGVRATVAITPAASRLPCSPAAAAPSRARPTVRACTFRRVAISTLLTPSPDHRRAELTWAGESLGRRPRWRTSPADPSRRARPRSIETYTAVIPKQAPTSVPEWPASVRATTARLRIPTSSLSKRATR
jgi:hypothetical protein